MDALGVYINGMRRGVVGAAASNKTARWRGGLWRVRRWTHHQQLILNFQLSFALLCFAFLVGELWLWSAMMSHVDVAEL